MTEVTYLNGNLVSPDKAVISVNDRGFLFGDAIYEVLRSYNGRLWAFDRHMQRLERSLTAIDMGYVRVDRIATAVRETYAASGIPDALLYLQITRGVAPRSHTYTRDLEPTILITVRDISASLSEVDEGGMTAITCPDLRWRRCDIKSTNLLPNILAKTEAHDCGAYEAILVHPDGYITEGSSTSVFWTRDGVVATIFLGPEVLPSVSRGIVVEIVKDRNIPFTEERISLGDFREVEEIFLASTTPEVCPIIELDGNSVGNGRAGPMAQQLREEFRARVEAGDDAIR